MAAKTTSPLGSAGVVTPDSSGAPHAPIGNASVPYPLPSGRGDATARLAASSRSWSGMSAYPLDPDFASRMPRVELRLPDCIGLSPSWTVSPSERVTGTGTGPVVRARSRLAVGTVVTTVSSNSAYTS